MGKINKKLLKSIVKECLVEILAEGLVPGQAKAVDKKRTLKESVYQTSGRLNKRQLDSNLGTVNRQPSNQPTTSNQSHLDSISYNNQQQQQEVQQQRPSLNVTKDPIMNAIFADTAASTLRAQAAAETGRSAPAVTQGGDEAARIVEASDPMELFESAGKWADMAFAPKLNR
jgi:hypothetical protein